MTGRAWFARRDTLRSEHRVAERSSAQPRPVHKGNFAGASPSTLYDYTSKATGSRASAVAVEMYHSDVAGRSLEQYDLKDWDTTSLDRKC